MRFLFVLIICISCSTAQPPPVETTSSDSIARKYDHLIDEIKSPFPGHMYKPKGVEKAPVIVLLHGSDGGNGNFSYRPGRRVKTGSDALVPWIARYYASRGFVTLALCYFDCRHHTGYDKYPPDELMTVDVQDVVKAYEWAKQTYSPGDNRWSYT